MRPSLGLLKNISNKIVFISTTHLWSGANTQDVLIYKYMPAAFKKQTAFKAFTNRKYSEREREMGGGLSGLTVI